MNDETITVALILGSAREGRFCDTVAAWTRAQIAKRHEFSLKTIDPAELVLAGHQRQRPNDDQASLRQRLGQADAFVVVTPEYNHGYPAALKALIDSAGAEWQAKPVAFVSYGGASGGLRAVEQLRQVFAELHAVTVRDSVSFAGAWEHFDAGGELHSPERAQRAMTTLLGRLHWWAVALRNARHAVPYAEAVA